MKSSLGQTASTVKREILRRAADTLDLFVCKRHYSQCGEDAVMQAIFENQMAAGRTNFGFVNRPKLKPGFYIDVGAFSPKRYSNTYWFYRRGWRGITVEPNPQSTSLFRRIRPRDIHLCCAVGPSEGEIYYHSGGYICRNFVSDSVATAEGFVSHKIPCLPLSTIVEKHVPVGQTIHFLSVDCEGFDLSVLRSANWEMNRPWYVLTEIHHHNLADLIESEIMKFMESIGYEMVSWTLATVIFQDSKRPGAEKAS